MAMGGWGERAHLPAGVWVRRARPGLGAAGGRAGLAFDHDRHRGIDDPGACQRVKAEDGGGGQATARREAIGRADFVTVQLRQGVDEVAEQGWLGMFPPVPRRVLARVMQPEIGGEIDDRRSQRLQLVDLAAGLAVREREKEYVNRLEG